MFGKRDPVCGVKVDKKSRYTAKYGGKVYYFDCPACKNTFEANPETFVGKKSRDGGVLESLAKRRGEVPKSCHDIKK
ncbi:MAG: YHS domain-containing protein [Candidatus Eisenbacteria bacterium]